MNSRLLALARRLACADEKSCTSSEAISAPPQAVFLHGGWRCGSTYVWSRFRECAATRCFYEPFNEALARCTARKIGRDTTLTWNSRHPALDRPYRDEYLPLLRRAGLRGVRGFRQEFSLAEYFPARRGIEPQLDYLRRLIQQAHGDGKCPVLGFSRSLARAEAIKRALGGWHIVIHRNPRQQWLSCRSYRIAEGAVYFELCHFLILALAPSHSPAGRYARELGLPRPPAGEFRKQLRYLHRALGPWSDELSYRAFLGVQHLSQTAASCAADLTIDIDRLSREPHYQRKVTAAILEGTGLAVRFEDCRMGAHETAGMRLDFAAVERDVLRQLGSCGAETAAEGELGSTVARA